MRRSLFLLCLFSSGCHDAIPISSDAAAPDALQRPAPDASAPCSGNIDFSTDAHNCGACGHDCTACGASTCRSGRCEPVVLASAQSDPAGIAVDARNVYWTDGGPRGGGGTVLELALSGGAPVVLASSPDPRGTAVDATDLYWTDLSAGTINRVPLNGGAQSVLVTGQLAPVGIAVDSANVYWTNIMGNLAGSVMKAPRSGGAAIRLATGGAFQLAIDSTSVYWTGQGILKTAIGGGTPVTLAPALLPLGIAVDATSVYWADSQAGAIAKVALAGGSPETIAASQPSPIDLAIDRRNVYWRNESNGTVMRAPLGGGAPVVLASGQTFPQFPYGTGIAVDAACVYWTTQGMSDGRVMRVASGAADGATRVPPPDLGAPEDLTTPVPVDSATSLTDMSTAPESDLTAAPRSCGPPDLGPDMAMCLAPRVLCSGQCVDLTNDPNNCGSCGAACRPGEVCDSALFSAPTLYPLAGPGVLATGDLDGDGRPDIAVADSGTSTVGVILDNGNGVFRAANSYSVDTGPAWIAIADLNGDNEPDVLTVNAGSVSVLLNQGAGTFSAHVDYPVDPGAGAVAVVDLDGDGHPDVASGPSNNGTVSVLLNRGDGTFGAQATYPVSVGFPPNSLLTSDLNGDGNQDLIVQGAFGFSVLLGSGHGLFRPALDHKRGSVSSVAIADFNGDGRPDVAESGSPFGASLLFGNGDGSFQAPVDYDVALGSLKTADLNGDGAPDLIGTGPNDAVSVLLNGCDGRLTARKPDAVGPGPSEMALGDYNGDGKTDVAVLNRGAFDNVSVLLGVGDGTFQTPVNLLLGFLPNDLRSADFDGDGRADLAVTGPGGVAVLLEGAPRCEPSGFGVDGGTCPAPTATGADLGAPACSAARKAQAWSVMVTQPIVLPGRAAGLSLEVAGGLTLTSAEAIDCQSDSQGDQFGDCTFVNSWGDNGEVWLVYQPVTGVARMLTLWPGYAGVLAFRSPDGLHSYEMGVQTQVQKDGAPFTLATGWSGSAFDDEVDELYRGLVATYAPQVPLDAAGVTCIATKKCLTGMFGTIGYVSIPSVGFAFWVDNVNAAQPTPSIPTRFDLTP